MDLLKCETCDKKTKKLYRTVIKKNYNAMLKKPLWNCYFCYKKKNSLKKK